ncbi:MAG TPA: hypothetical protein DCR14_04125 [Acidimicrobiaceae bacterium]|nr:hypothetical protein [Acidimicrobiaceae bacterium]
MQGVAPVAADAAQAAAGVAATYADPTQTKWPTTAPTNASFTDPVKAAVDAVIPATGYTGVATYFDNASSAATTSTDTLSAMRKVAEASAGQFKVFDSSDPSKNNRALPAGSADRWMDLQFSFSADDMTSDSSSSALSSTTDWSVDLFLGSASGKSQTSSANAAKNALDTSTTIQIGLKATKVDISRGWFDPGVFKLSKNMNRFTDQKVSWGSVDVAPASGQPGTSIRADLKNANGAILPSYPVSFVVVKDVTIQFTASESSLDAVQSVLDSQSAVGGGFLCFSASSSSTSHSDASALHTKTVGTVVNINMPGPQILGWFIEFTPEDTSQPVTDVQVPPTGGPLDITQYVAKLMRYGSEPSTPAQPVGGGVA